MNNLLIDRKNNNRYQMWNASSAATINNDTQFIENNLFKLNSMIIY